LQEAVEALNICRRELTAQSPQDNDIFRNEMKRSLEALDQIEKEIRERIPLTELESLEREKAAAIKEQRYEDAARLRDRINALRTKQPGPTDVAKGPEAEQESPRTGEPPV
jgi:protein-arginine kinase activator protein McsA